MKREVDPQTGKLPDLGRAGSAALLLWGYAGHGDSTTTPALRIPPAQGEPWLEGLQQVGYPQRGAKKRDADKQFDREHCPPLILSPHTAVQQPRGPCHAGCHCRVHSLHQGLGSLLALDGDHRGRAALLPLLQPLSFQASPPILGLHLRRRPKRCHSFLAQTKSALLSSRIQHGAIYHKRKR